MLLYYFLLLPLARDASLVQVFIPLLLLQVHVNPIYCANLFFLSFLGLPTSSSCVGLSLSSFFIYFFLSSLGLATSSSCVGLYLLSSSISFFLI
jgi:hypothetical protein